MTSPVLVGCEHDVFLTEQIIAKNEKCKSHHVRDYLFRNRSIIILR
jgi:hypothetical protein